MSWHINFDLLNLQRTVGKNIVLYAESNNVLIKNTPYGDQLLLELRIMLVVTNIST